MATRLKTIEYAFPFYNTSVASATRYDFSAITLYIPENTSRTFLSVIVEVNVMDSVTTATSLTAHLVGCKLGAASFSDDSDSLTLAQSGESDNYKLHADFTSYFNTNFGSGTSQTCQVGITITGPSVINHSAKIYITYEYDDSSQQTRVKTARIPIESLVGALTATLAEVGTNQVPNLDSFLPESSKTYRNIWFEFTGNNTANGSTDANFCFALDSESEVQTGLIENGMTSSRYTEIFWVRNDMATNATHALKIRSTSITGNRWEHLGIMLCVTYEYDHTNSTSILNSLVLPFKLQQGAIGNTTSGDQSLEKLKFFIEETSPSLVQSGIKIFYPGDYSYDFVLACGSQSTRTYTNTNLAFCGGLALTHRIDSGAAGGAGISIARGENTLTIKAYSSGGQTYIYGNIVGFLILNYTSSKHASGADVHNHSIHWGIIQKGSFTRVKSATIQPLIPESNYYLNWAGVYVIGNQYAAPSYGIQASVVDCERAAGEGAEAGFETILSAGSTLMSDVENGVFTFAERTDSFKRHPGDPNANRLDIEGSRIYRWTSPQFEGSVDLWLTYHAITYSVAGTISGSGGGTINIGIFRSATGEKVASTSRVGNGAYSVTWYDNVESLFAEAREDSTHVGRSDTTTAA